MACKNVIAIELLIDNSICQVFDHCHLILRILDTRRTCDDGVFVVLDELRRTMLEFSHKQTDGI